MKKLPRRTFIQQLGLGSSSLFVGKNLMAGIPYKYPLQTYQQAPLDAYISDRNEIAVRFCYRPENHPTSGELQLTLNCDQLVRGKAFYFGSQVQIVDNQANISLAANPERPGIAVCWITPSESLTMEVKQGETTYQFRLSDLLNGNAMEIPTPNGAVHVDLLGYSEVETFDPASVGISETGDAFSIAILADPQGGDPTDLTNESPTRMKIHNAFIEQSVHLVNLEKPRPVFAMILGDISDSKGQASNFNQMHSFINQIKVPVLYNVGNHETTYGARFGPGYDHSAFDNFLQAQRRINGMEALLYSFNIGGWHFIVWPDPLRTGFWDTHVHYLDWLEHDLEVNRSTPTVFMQHIPMHPIGIDPLINYVEAPDVKRSLLDILAKHGNVKYVLSGHVHIPVKSSVKTAVTYKGMKLINLPAAGYRPRGFGEADYNGGPSQGVAFLDFEGNQASLRFKTVTNLEYTYPEKLPAFQPENYPFWLKYGWELTPGKALVNGSFKQGINGWQPRYVYTEDENPANRMEVISERQPRLYLQSHPRGYMSPGQDRMPQSINRVAQSVQHAPGAPMGLRLTYRVPEPYMENDAIAGAYLWVEGYENDTKKLNSIYALHTVPGNVGGKYSQDSNAEIARFRLPEQQNWYSAMLDVFQDYTRVFPEADLAAVDRVIIHLGTWTSNFFEKDKYGVEVQNIELVAGAEGDAVPVVSGDEIWWGQRDHIAGEHMLVNERVADYRG